MPDVEPQPVAPPPPPPVVAHAGPSRPTLAGTAPGLAFTLGHIRRATRTRTIIATLLMALAVSVAVLLVAALLIVARQEWARIAGWIGGAVAFVAVLTRGIIIGRRREDERITVRALGRVAPDDASDLLSAVELLRSEAAPGASQALIREHVTRMGARAATLDPRQALDSRPALIAGAVLLAALLVHGLLLAFGGARVRDAYAFLGGKVSARSMPLFARSPIAGDIKLTYRYPAHMNKPNRTVPGTDGDISAPKGTVVTIAARADRDVQRASIVLTVNEHEQSQPLQVHGRELGGELIIDKAGKWRFAYQRESGSVVAEGPDKPVSVEPDQPPQVSLTKPKQELEVMGKEILTLGYTASDDYGLRGIDLVWSGGHGSPEQRKQIFHFKEESKRERGDFTWDLATLGMQPGDRIDYHLEAWDNDSVSGGDTGKKASSESHVLKIFSETEHHEEVLNKAREQWERLIGGTGNRLEEPSCGPSGEKVTDEWRKAALTHDGELTAVASDMREFSHTLAKDKHAPPELGLALAHVASRLVPVIDDTSDARLSLFRFHTPSYVRAFTSAGKSEQREEEHDILYLEDLMDCRRLLDLAELTRELEAGRKELANLVKQFQDSPTDENRQKILAQVARLKERLHELNRRMHELAGEIQDEHLNTEAKEMMNKGDDMMSKLDKVQHDLQKGGGEDAMKAVQDLEKQVDDMEKKFNDRAGEADDEQKKLNEKVQQLASDFFDVQAEETQLKQETDRVKAKQGAAAKEQLKKLGNDFGEKQRERLKRAMAEFNAIEPDAMGGFGDAERMQGTRDRLSQLDRALQGGDFSEALDQAEGAMDESSQLRHNWATEAEMAHSSSIFQGLSGRAPKHGRTDDAQVAMLQKADDHATHAQQPLGQIADDLAKLMKSAKPSLSDADRKQMEEMGKKQSGLQRRTDGLAKRIEEIGKEAPIAGPEQTALLEQAESAMGKAKDGLGGGDSRGASMKEGSALQKLGEFAKSMKKSGGGGSGGGGMPQPFGTNGDEAQGEGEGQGDQEGGQGTSREAVDVPGQDDSHAPAEFRRDLLDAMKDKSPDNYRDRVRSYYNELVK